MIAICFFCYYKKINEMLLIYFFISSIENILFYDKWYIDCDNYVKISFFTLNKYVFLKNELIIFLNENNKINYNKLFNISVNVKNDEKNKKKLIYNNYDISNINIFYFDVYNINKKYNGQVINVIFNCFGSILIVLLNKIEIYVPYIKYKYILNVNFVNKFIVVNW